jgi:hypothetical protein
MRVNRTVYPITQSLVTWLNETLCPIEKGAFEHWRQLLPLVRICDDAMDGTVPKYAAISAIRQYNDSQGTTFTLEEIIGRLDYSFSGTGEWAAYVNLDDQEKLLFGEHDEAFVAFEKAPEDVQWIVVWLPEEGSAVVFRSPYICRREIFDEEGVLCDGLTLTGQLAYTLPPSIEGSIQQDLWRRVDERRPVISVDLGEGNHGSTTR